MLFSLNFTTSSCQSEHTEQLVHIVAQPEVEINKIFGFAITYKVKPDSVWSNSDQIENLELTEKFNKSINRIEESTTTYEGGNTKTKHYYSSSNWATPTKLGKVNFPIIFYKIKDKVYQTKPFSINVVENLKVNSNSVILKLSSDKETYKLGDTIKIQLLEFSKFDLVSRFSKREFENAMNNLNVKGEQNAIKITFEKKVDDIVGIPDFEKYIDERFEVIRFDWNPFNQDRSIAQINNVNFIQSKIFELTVLAKQKGDFTIGSSEFEYFITKSETDARNNIEPSDEEGWHKLTKKNSTKVSIQSNPLKIKVK